MSSRNHFDSTAENRMHDSLGVTLQHAAVDALDFQKQESLQANRFHSKSNESSLSNCQLEIPPVHTLIHGDDEIARMLTNFAKQCEASHQNKDNDRPVHHHAHGKHAEHESREHYAHHPHGGKEPGSETQHQKPTSTSAEGPINNPIATPVDSSSNKPISIPADSASSKPLPTSGDGIISTTANNSGSLNTDSAAPNWSQFTKANNNFPGNVPPSYWAQKLPDTTKLVDTNYSPAPHIYTDSGILINLKDYAPSQLRTVPVYRIDGSAWANGGMDRANSRTLIGTVQMPDGFVMPPSDHNNPFTLITPDGKDISLNAFTRLSPTGPIWGVEGAGAHGGSATSNVGTLTAQDVNNAIKNGTAPDHKLQLTMWVGDVSPAGSGHVYPAATADSNYKGQYTGSNPNFKMGSTLAIPKTITAQSLGLETALGKALLQTFQNYGAVVVDTAPGNISYLGTSTDAQQQYQANTGSQMFASNSAANGTAFSRDMQKLLEASKIAL